MTLLEHMNITLNQITAGCGGTQEADPWAWTLALVTEWIVGQLELYSNSLYLKKNQ